MIDFQRTKKGDKSGTAWNGFGDIEKAISIIEDGSRANIDAKLGMMHKVRSFYNNILSPMSDQGDVTIDTHAVAAAHLRPFSGNHVEVKENFKRVASQASPAQSVHMASMRKHTDKQLQRLEYYQEKCNQ